MASTAPASTVARRLQAGVAIAVVVAVAALSDRRPVRTSPSGVSSPANIGSPRTHPDVPAASGLDHDLLGALRRAAADAQGDGVQIHITSGRRSPAHQAQLLREAIAKYGSLAEATRWVATPNTSAHVSGDAVDVGPESAAMWLSERGAAYGLCQIYGNEPWHYELRPAAIADGCPPTYSDPTQDPRMHR